MSSSGDIWRGRRRHNTPQFNDVAICQLVYCVRVCPRGQTRSLETVDGRQNGAVSKRESISAAGDEHLPTIHSDVDAKAVTAAAVKRAKAPDAGTTSAREAE